MKRLQQGFTLIEIMIVVAIIGMLAAIATVNYARSRKIAQRQICIVNLKQIDGAIQEWALEERTRAGDRGARGQSQSAVAGRHSGHRPRAVTFF